MTDVDIGVGTKPNVLDARHWFGTYRILGHIISLVSNNTHCIMKDCRLGSTQYALQTNKLPANYQALPSFIGTKLCVTRDSPPATIVIDVEGVASVMSNKKFMNAKKLSTFIYGICEYCSPSGGKRKVKST